MISNAFHNRSITLQHYRIRIPVSWVIYTDHRSYLRTLDAPGIALIGVGRYWKNEVPVSGSVFYPISRPEEQLTESVPLAGARILEKRSFRFGNENLNCWDHIRFNKYVGPSIAEPEIAEIGCSSESNDFYAHFFGWRGDSPAFYATLQEIVVEK